MADIQDRLQQRILDDTQMEETRQIILSRPKREIEERLKKRETEDLTVPHQCDAAYIYYPAGAELEQIDSFTIELTEIVDKMKEDMINETRILEGTEIPVYQENELSNSNPVEEQWKSVLPNGSLTIDPIPDSIHESNISSSFVEPSDPNYRIVRLEKQYTLSPRSSCSGNSAASGNETDAMNEYSECTVPMTSELMLGTLNEVK